MTTQREAVLSALTARLGTISISGLAVVREQAEPRFDGTGPWIHIGDGDPGDPEDVTLSPLTYHWVHPVPVVVTVRGASLEDRKAALDALLAAIGPVIAADRRISATANWSEAEAPVVEEIYLPGDIAARQASLNVVVEYDSDGPLE